MMKTANINIITATTTTIGSIWSANITGIRAFMSAMRIAIFRPLPVCRILRYVLLTHGVLTWSKPQCAASLGRTQCNWGEWLFTLLKINMNRSTCSCTIFYLLPCLYSVLFSRFTLAFYIDISQLSQGYRHRLIIYFGLKHQQQITYTAYKAKYCIWSSYTVIKIVYTQQTLSMGPINISLRTLTIICDYLRCRVTTIRLHWINSDIKQIYPLRFISIV